MYGVICAMTTPFDENDKMIKEKYYNGRICLDYKGKRYGIKKLKKYITKKEVELIELPF